MAGNPEGWPEIVQPEAFDRLTERTIPVVSGGRVVGQGTWRVDEDADGLSTEFRLLPTAGELEAGDREPINVVSWGPDVNALPNTEARVTDEMRWTPQDEDGRDTP